MQSPSFSKSWYEVASGAELRQGSLLRTFPIPKPPKNVTFDDKGQPKPVGGKVRVSDIVVLSQSCDLAQNKSGLVLVAPIVDLKQADTLAGKEVLHDEMRLQKFREQIRRGYQPSLHMLAACFLEGHQQEVQVVDFRQAITVGYAHLLEFASASNNHLRLLSPFREQLSQAFARFFMRVALESDADIPSFSPLP